MAGIPGVEPLHFGLHGTGHVEGVVNEATDPTRLPGAGDERSVFFSREGHDFEFLDEILLQVAAAWGETRSGLGRRVMTA